MMGKKHTAFYCTKGPKKITALNLLSLLPGIIVLAMMFEITTAFAINRAGHNPLTDPRPNTQYYFVMVNQAAILNAGSPNAMRAAIRKALATLAEVVTPHVNSLQQNKPAALRTQLMQSQHHNGVFIVGFNAAQTEAQFLTGLQAPDQQRYIEYFPVSDLVETILNPTAPRLSTLGSHSPYLSALQATLGESTALRKRRPVLWSATDALLHLSTIQQAGTRHSELPHELAAPYQQALTALATHIADSAAQYPIELLAAATLEPTLFRDLFLTPDGRVRLMIRLTNTISNPEQFLGEARQTRHPTRDRYWVVPEPNESDSAQRALAPPPVENTTRHRWAAALWTLAFAETPEERRELGNLLRQRIIFRLRVEASMPRNEHYDVVRDVLNAINDAATEPAPLQWRQLDPEVRYSKYLQALEGFVADFLGYLAASSITLQPEPVFAAKTQEIADSLLLIRAHLAELSASRVLEEQLACSSLLVAPPPGVASNNSPRRLN